MDSSAVSTKVGAAVPSHQQPGMVLSVKPKPHLRICCGLVVLLVVEQIDNKSAFSSKADQPRFCVFFRCRDLDLDLDFDPNDIGRTNFTCTF